MIWGSGGLPRQAASKMTPNKKPKHHRAQSVLEGFLKSFLLPDSVLCSMFIFGSGFGKPPAPILRISGHFRVLLQNSKNVCNLSNRNPCFLKRWDCAFAVCLQFSCSQERIFQWFWQIWASKAVFLQIHTRCFRTFCMKKNVLKSRLEKSWF